jgi:oligoendopeptidase F
MGASRSGRIKNAADLDALSLSVWSRFEIWPASEPQYAMSERDPAGFAQRYAELLRKGFYAAPEDLLRSFFGRGLSQQERADACMTILQRRIEMLGKAYKTIDAAH